MTRFSILCTFILALSSSISGNVLVPRDLEGCGGSLFVEDAVVIDAPLSANCKWKIQTDEKNILVFTVVHNGNFKQVEEFLSIHDGFEIDSSVLLFENQRVHEVSNKKLPETVYTTGPVAEVRFKKTPTSVLKLKIQKAVSCPFNLGVESQCGRLMDETSCYCATFTKRDHVSQTAYCPFWTRMVHEVSNKELPEAVYTTGSVAEVRLKKAPTSVLKLKIQKAVDCPFNLGVESSCGRVVDEISCYCATFTKRSHASQTSYCNSHSMKLLAIESYAEELAIQAAWTTENFFWTSGNDKSIEGKWIWESTGVNLSPGYTNWSDGNPDNYKEEDCLGTGWVANGRPGWNDFPCGNVYDAICEAHA